MNVFKQFAIKEREHFLRATILPFGSIIDGLVTLFTLGLCYTSFGIKATIVIAKRELKNKGIK